MTAYLVRTDLQSTEGLADDTVLLDWAPGKTAATIQTGDAGPEFFTGWRPTRPAADLFLLGSAVYCADKTTRRRPTLDAWTREVEIMLPVAEVEAWQAADIGGALNFLTGDHWQIEPYASTRHPLADVAGVPDGDRPTGLGVDGVCLFSGGLDSLCGVIDLLEEDPQRRLCLVSHHEGGQASTAQQALLGEIVQHYGEHRLISRRLYLRPAPTNGEQARPLPSARENTTRSCSLLFLSAALALAAADGHDIPVYVPENGFIGINVPLTRARVGSSSTRTTHPHFMHQLATSAAAIGITNAVVNPYRHQTKGEMLAGSRNPGLLRRLAPVSVSCSHPETARYVGREQGNCGYCFPCLIRRASLHHAGWDDDVYAWDVFVKNDLDVLLDSRRARGADLRAVIASLTTTRPDRDVLRNGPLPQGERDAFVGVWRRGVVELRDWLGKHPDGTLASLVQPSS